MSDEELEFDFNDSSLPARSRSTIAHAQIVHSPTSNAQHLNNETILQYLAEKQFPLEDSELIFRPLEEAENDTHFAASYQDGAPISRVVSTAWAPTVSIVFMPGLDKMAVNQAEQLGITGEEPKQKSPRWRVLTAGNFLATLEFDDNLTLKRTDCTPQIVADMIRRGSGSNEDRGGSALFRISKENRVLTIDSDNVKLVNSLQHGSTDLEATLIEVDKSSLFNLVIDFHRIVRDGGAALNTDIESRVKLLEVMIEHARRLAIRSPILFRMSTRQQIARSKNTRYGVDHGSLFETITTSVGIKNIISKSAACFNSLDALRNDEHTEQSLIRPKFLQMLVLLLSLLNDADLESISEFLEETYRIKADRTHIELLILKVLPLQSINKSIFVRDMVNAVQKDPGTLPTSQEETWNSFIKELLELGYVLPGFTQQMGQPDVSWIVKFPRGEGFKNSYVFNNLQYHDQDHHINIIPSMNLAMDSDNGEVTSILTNGKRYLIRATDHQKITGMVFGDYSVTEATQQKRNCDLSVSEAFVNDFLNKAIQKTNHLLGIVNNYFATVKTRRKIVKAITGRFEDMNLGGARPKPYRYPDIAGCGRLTWHQAKLNGELLAVAYKVEGKKIARRDLIRNLVNDTRKVNSMLHYIELEINRNDGRRKSEETKQTIAALQKAIPEIRKLIVLTEQNKKVVENTNLDISDEPISQTIFPSHATADRIDYWSQYNARLVDGRRHLRVEAYCKQVTKVTWISDEVIEINLINPMSKKEGAKQFFVSPLQYIAPEHRRWEIRVEDEVLMMGQHLVIVKKEEDDEVELPAQPMEKDELHTYYAYSPTSPASPTSPTQSVHGDGAPTEKRRSKRHVARRPLPTRGQPYIFLNWLKIVGVPKGVTDPRLQNRQRPDQMGDFMVH